MQRSGSASRSRSADAAKIPPAASSATDSRQRPATATAGMPAARAAAATPAGAVPRRVGASRQPSPVITARPSQRGGNADQLQDQPDARLPRRRPARP